MSNDKFVNPYNFISLADHKAKAYSDQDKHTGVIHYRLTTKSPLFIPNSSTDCAFKESIKCPDHKSFDFFSYTLLDSEKCYENEYRVPVIPGSEIRGVIRNVYETLTDSCMGLINEEEYPVKRSSEAFKAALLCRNQDGTFSIVKALSKRIKIDSRGLLEQNKLENFANGQKLYSTNDYANNNVITEYTINRTNQFKYEGFLLKWGMGVRKKHYHLYFKDNRSYEEAVLEKSYIEQTLERVILSYLDQPSLSYKDEQAYNDYLNDLKQYLNSSGEKYFPVNYSKLDDTHYYLAPAVFTKEVSFKSMKEIIGEFAPCEDTLCPTCDLFGYIQKEQSSSSKIRFSDLYVEKTVNNNKDYYLYNKITLPALGSPKVNNVDFYLVKPEGASYWTYDYYIKNGAVILYNAKIRGRKYYWHHQNVSFLPDIPADRLNKTIRPLKENIVFTGELYFDGISNKQLEQLIWILNTSKEGLGYKLGTGKPLGLGSVVCEVTSVEERVISCKDDLLQYSVNQKNITNKSYEEVGFSKSVKEEFYKISCLTTIPKNQEISYPKTKETDKGFEWYTENHKPSKMINSRKKMIIKESLPKLTDPHQTLPYDLKIPYSNNHNKSYKKR